MAFSREVHNRIRGVFFEDIIKSCAVTYVGLHKGVVRSVCNWCQIFEACSIGQSVEVDHLMTVPHGLTDDGRSNKTGTAGYKQFHSLAS